MHLEPYLKTYKEKIDSLKAMNRVYINKVRI